MVPGVLPTLNFRAPYIAIAGNRKRKPMIATQNRNANDAKNPAAPAYRNGKPTVPGTEVVKTGGK